MISKPFNSNALKNPCFSMVHRLTTAVWILFLLLLMVYNPSQANPVDQAKKLSAEGLELARKNRIDEAIDKFNHSLEMNPRDGETYVHLANAYLQISNLDAAEVACQQAKLFLPEMAEVYATMSQIFHRRGELEAAKREYEQAIRLDSNVAEYHYDLANVYHSLGQFGAAKKEYLATLDLSPKSPLVYHNLGEIYHLEGKLDQAIEAYQKSLSYSNDDQNTKKRLNEVIQKKQEQIGKEILRNQLAIVHDPDNAQKYRKLALSYYRARQLEEAIKSLQVALYLEPNSEQIRYDLENVLQQKKNALEEVLTDRLERIELEPRNPEYHHDLGLIYFNQDNLTEAEKHFRLALESNSNLSIVWLSLGKLLKKTKERTAARQALQRCIRLDPSSPDTYQHLGLLEKTDDNFDLAIHHLLKAKSILRSNQQIYNLHSSAKFRNQLAVVHFHLGETYHHQKKLKDAMTAYHTAIRLKPDYVLAYLRLADIYRNIGNDGSSLSFYNRFLKLASPRQQLDTEVRRVSEILKQ